MAVPDFETMMRLFHNRLIKIEFATGNERIGTMQAFCDFGMLVGVGEETQFIPFAQVKSISEVQPKKVI